MLLNCACDIEANIDGGAQQTSLVQDKHTFGMIAKFSNWKDGQGKSAFCHDWEPNKT